MKKNLIGKLEVGNWKGACNTTRLSSGTHRELVLGVHRPLQHRGQAHPGICKGLRETMMEIMSPKQQMQRHTRAMAFAALSLSLLSSSLHCDAFRSVASKHIVHSRRMLAGKEEFTIKNREEDIWTSRRKIIRSTLKPMVKRQIDRKKIAIEKAKNNPEVKSVDDDKKKKPTGLLVSAFFIAVSATVLRLGGRTAFVQMLGLDFVTGSGIKTQVNDFVEFFHSMGDVSQYAAFFFAWLAAKAFCIDAFTIVLALSSGVLFGGIFEGTAVSVICSSTASLCIFFLSR